jgi:hypothetical protein
MILCDYVTQRGPIITYIHRNYNSFCYFILVLKTFTSTKVKNRYFSKFSKQNWDFCKYVTGSLMKQNRSIPNTNFFNVMNSQTNS